MNQLPVIFGYNINGTGNSSVPLSLCRYWNEAGLESTLYAPSRDSHVSYPWLQVAMGPLKKKFVYRFGGSGTPTRLAETYGLKHSANHSVVYLWAGLSMQVFEEAKKQGRKIVVERINCCQETARNILDNVYMSLDIEPDHGITEEAIATEGQKLDLADAIFCPSPMVRKSMIEAGIDEDKLLDASYGWSPERFPSQRTEKSGNGSKVTYLFVGTLCVRKGVPLLLRSWEEAGIDGELIFVGAMDDTIRTHYGRYFERPDITHVPYTTDIGTYYEQADIFVFPSFEEGGPMVTYEAMAHGALPLVSEMGAGAIVEHKINGLVLDQTVDAWCNAIMAVYKNRTRRAQLARAAVTRAYEFTWDKVAKRRADALRGKFSGLW